MLGLTRKSPPRPPGWRRWATDFTQRLQAGGADIPGRTFADSIDDAARAAGIDPAAVQRITVAQIGRNHADVILRVKNRKPVTVAVRWPGIAASIVGN